MNIHQLSDYREIVRQLLKRQKKLGHKTTLHDVAKAVNVQRPYLSKVLNGNADLNSEQMFYLCKFFSLSDEQADYMNLLLERDRATRLERKKSLESKIKLIRNRNLDIQQNLDAKPIELDEQRLSAYYLDPTVQIVHLFLTISRYKKEPALIAEALSISQERLNDIFQTLADLKLIEVRGDQFHVLIENVHLAKDSVLCHPHQALSRIKATQRLMELGKLELENSSYSFSLCFSADAHTRRLIQERFLKFLRETERLVKGANAEEVLQINFDLFPWSRP